MVNISIQKKRMILKERNSRLEELSDTLKLKAKSQEFDPEEIVRTIYPIYFLNRAALNPTIRTEIETLIKKYSLIHKSQDLSYRKRI
jgi:hypothetical protein